LDLLFFDDSAIRVVAANEPAQNAALAVAYLCLSGLIVAVLTSSSP
jgi:hypothetical protein